MRTRPLPPIAILASTTATVMCTPFKNDDTTANSGGDPSWSDSGPRCDPSAPFDTPVPVAGLENIGSSVGGLRLSEDELSGYFFAGGRPDTVGDHDIYAASRESQASAFRSVIHLPGDGINAPGKDQRDPTASGDGLMLVFARSPTSYAAGQLLYAIGESGIPFAGANPLPGSDFSGTNDLTPFLRQDGKKLYFASYRDPTLGLAIFSAERSDGGFINPQSVGANVNVGSRYLELYPAVTPDDLTLYYASSRTDGNPLGGYDIWVVTRPSADEPFSSQNPVDVFAVNSAANDYPTFVTADGCILYFASDRGGSLSMYVAARKSVTAASIAPAGAGDP